MIFDPEAIGDGAGVLIEAGLESGHPPAEILGQRVARMHEIVTDEIQPK